MFLRLPQRVKRHPSLYKSITHPASLCVLIGLVLGAHHLFDPIWHDEAYMLEFFASHPLNALTDYHLPNNHILFSFLLACYKELFGIGDLQVFWLRLFPLVSFLISITLLCCILNRVQGKRAAWLGGLLFVASHVVLNFALELRGYGFSWLPLTLSWYLLLRYVESEEGHRKKQWFYGYALTAIATVGILPTNLLLFGVITAVSVFLHSVRIQEFRIRMLLEHVCRIGIPPVLGLIFLIPVGDQLSQAVNGAASTSLETWVIHVPWATLSDLWWITPFFVYGIYRTIKAFHFRENNYNTAWGPLLFGLTLILPCACIAVLPVSPPVRIFVPFLPLLYGAMGIAVAAGTPSTLKYSRVLFFLLACVLVSTGFYREYVDAGYGKRHSSAEIIEDNLYDQHYQDNFGVEKTVHRIMELTRNHSYVFWVGSSDPFTFFWYIRRTDRPPDSFPNDIIWAKMYKKDPDRYEDAKQTDRRIGVVARSRKDARKTLDMVGLDKPWSLEQDADFGHFQIFLLRKR